MQKAAATTPKRTNKPKASRSTKSASSPAKAEGARKIPASAWIINLLLAGAFLVFLVYLSRIPDTQLDEDNKPEGKPATAGTAAAKDSSIDYRYEEILPEAEVVPPNVDDYRPSEDSSTIWYHLQTGSFRTPDGAEAQKAKIAFLGIRASIRPTVSQSGTTWYRVEVGPIQSRSHMNQVVDKLVDINIQPIVRKVKAEP